MFKDVRLFGVTTTYNEEKLIPYVMPYLERLCYDKLIVYDNESTDNTVELLKQYPFVEIRTYSTNGIFDEAQKTMVKINTTEDYRIDYCDVNDTYTWFTICDFDEVYYYNAFFNFNFKQSLLNMSVNGYNVITEDICDIICKKFPNTDKLIHKYSDYVMLSPNFWNKPNIFLLNGLDKFYCSTGNHNIELFYKNMDTKQFYNNKFLSAFHIKFIDINYIKERDKIYSERNYIAYNRDIDAMYRFFEENDLHIEEYLKNKILNGNNDLGYIYSTNLKIFSD